MNRVLVAVDGSSYAWKALERAIDYGQAARAEIIVLHVVPLEDVPKELQDFAQIENIEPGDAVTAWRTRTMLQDKIVSEAKRRLNHKGVQHFKCIVVEGDPSTTIINVADEEDAEVIFLGHRGFSQWQSLLLGSVAHKVIQLAACTCVVVK